MKIRLGDADRERLGCPEWLDVQWSSISVREAEALELGTGLDYADSLELMQPKIVKLDEDTIRYSFKPKGMRLLVWLGLHRADVEASFADLDFDAAYVFGGWQTVRAPKADGSPPDEPPTPSTSPTSSRRTRSKKSPT